ncbi:MAG: hypothetical protein COS42_06190 [Flavobacteriales bacterium CG03_land_8_20_14_0_80_35_15]|nr:hypothetical protein [Zetaproteobacteria bacterium]OIO10949.1 MAG: hypothetical protein AUJ53_05785 [Flavobacteriaceae bacterium CG1_02_35_72]PIR13139.1 MAG: hypothetical protein COV50_06670 [Flavobacteriales bacterium CG11_big_fil_rev_8_21_14_0_20_35_7]PIV17173.1 MAG: hypothetical protein COS42_06190 [Flavobacteriales bacterium CG03_land_8_20_14_0_80_35_15]PIX07278.1 MAG: hypothetical protein COZ76_04355 [Flavobacteriales bacterium CG_4_8_14_3_um_filter_35_10]PJA05237.1 MAG: hypothetical p
MKKTTLYLMMLMLSFGAFSNTVMASEKNPTPTTTPKEMPAEVRVMLNRLDEIKAMDKSSLKHAERKALRKEVRAIKTEVRANGNGLYLSAGAIIIVLLLLLIL